MTGREPGPDAVDADVVLEHLQAFAHVGFLELDLRTEELYLSTQVFELLGIETGSVEAYLSCVHRDDVEVVRQVSERARTQPGPYRLRHRSIDGARLLEVRLQSVAGPGGRPVRFMGVISDVTTEWHLERALEDSASARLTGLLAGGAVHDLKNIFVVLLGHSQLALAADARGEPLDRESLEALERAATSGVELTQQLLQVGRHPDPVPGRRVDVDALFRRLSATARTALGRRREVSVDAGAGDVEILADEARLERAVVDLLLNARDALPPGGGSVALRFRTLDVDDGHVGPAVGELPPGTYGVVEVADDGAGMSADVLDRVTDAFFTTKGHEGSGVGLHAVARFVEAAGGALHIDSAPGRGTCVQLLLPARPRATEAPATRPSRRLAPARVLLHGADDDHRLDGVATALRARALQCVVTGSASAATAALRTEPIDLLVVDGSRRGDAALLRVAASSSVPVLGMADVAGPDDGGASPDSFVVAVVDAVEGVLGRRAQRVRG